MAVAAIAAANNCRITSRIPIIGAIAAETAPAGLERHAVEDELDLLAAVEQRDRFAQIALAGAVGADDQHHLPDMPRQHRGRATRRARAANRRSRCGADWRRQVRREFARARRWRAARYRRWTRVPAGSTESCGTSVSMTQSSARRLRRPARRAGPGLRAAPSRSSMSGLAKSASTSRISTSFSAAIDSARLIAQKVLPSSGLAEQTRIIRDLSGSDACDRRARY